MNRKELYDDKLQLDYFSDSYLQFESDFYKYSALDIPLTFITDDILRTMLWLKNIILNLIKVNL